MNHSIKDKAGMRDCLAWNLKHTQGLTYEKTGKVLGVTTERARQLSLRYERACRRTQRELELQEKCWLQTWGSHVTGEAAHLNEALNKC
jgi:hypothetical protein